MKVLIVLAALSIATPAMAQDAAPSDTNVTMIPAAPQWVAEVSAGYAKRDDGPSGAFAITGLNRRFGNYYARTAITTYRSIIEQADTALPSTYVVGSIGGGGNVNDWVFDGWVSYGWQHYGQISAANGTRRSTLHSGSPYVSFGLDAGRIMRLGHGIYATPTLGITYAHDRLLRPSPDATHWPDYESNERTLTGIAALRLDKTIGRAKQHYIGLAASWHITNNGLSVLVPPSSEGADFATRHFADGWGELGLNAGFRLTPRLRVETSITRSVAALSGNSTTASGGLRIAF
jgi:hypothetical protein